MSNGFETCDKHTYLFATEAKDCPYCRIDELEQQIAHKQEQCDQLAHQVLELKQQLADEKKAAGYWMEQSCKDHNRAEKAEQQLAALKQVSAELCPDCGWAMKFPDEPCCKCEVERLKSPLVDAPAAYENGRKQAAQEIIEEVIGDWNCDCGYGGLVIADAIRAKFGLEGCG